MINEDYKNRIQKLSGIILESKSDIINKKIGLPKDLADTIEDRFGNYSIWVANSFKEQLKSNARRGDISFKGRPIDENDFLEFLRSGDSEFEDLIWELFNDYNTRTYSYIHDWLRGRGSGPVIENDKLDFKTLTLQDAHRRAFEWHKKLEKIQGGQIKDEEGDVVMTFPDGYYWIRINKSKCEKEAKAMGHCGTGSGTLFSLRKDKYPFVTADIDSNGIVIQMRGRANTKPLEKYRDYIFDFILSKYVNGLSSPGYRSSDNFELSDLKKSQLDKIIKTKPQLLKDSSLSFMDEMQSEYVAMNHPEYLPIRELFDEKDLSLDKINKLVQTKEWWDKNLTSKKGSWGSATLDNIIKKFNDSGKSFKNILENAVLNQEILENILYNNLGSTSINSLISGIISLKNNFPNTVNAIDDLFLNGDSALNYFYKNKNLDAYINALMNDAIFSGRGLKKALKLMMSPNFKAKFLEGSTHIPEYYDTLIEIIRDSLKD